MDPLFPAASRAAACLRPRDRPPVFATRRGPSLPPSSARGGGPAPFMDLPAAVAATSLAATSPRISARRLQSRSSARPSTRCRPPSQPPPSLPPSARPSVRASSGRPSVWLSARCRPSSGRLSNQVAQQPLPLRPPVVDVLLLPAWVFFLASRWGLCSADRGCGCSCAALVCSAHI